MIPVFTLRTETPERDMVKKCEQEVMQGEGELCAPAYREVEGRRISIALALSGAGDTNASDDAERTSGKEKGGDSDDEDLYNSRTARRVRAFLDSTKEEDFVHNPSPVDEADVLTPAEGVDEDSPHRRWLERATADEVRSVAAETQRELLIALYDAITLETELMEMGEATAVLERTVGERDETIEMLKVQLVTADECNEELHGAKREALRKLSDAKTEMALLSKRNAKLSKLLQEKEEELRLCIARNAVASGCAALPVPERRDEGTITTGGPCSVLIEASASAGLPNSGSSCTSPPSMQSRHYELEEMLRRLQFARDTLQSTEKAKADLDQQLRQLAARVKESHAAAANGASASSSIDASQSNEKRGSSSGAESVLRCQCEDVARYAASLEGEVQQLREKLQAQRIVTSGAESNGAGRCEAATKAEAASRQQSAELPDSASAGAPPLHGQCCGVGCVVPASADVAFLRRQLDGVQAATCRLETELRAEREKSQRQRAVEKKLLESVVCLTRQLRAREALDRETRSQRRTSLYIDHSSRGDGASVRRGVSSAAENLNGEVASTWVPRSENGGADTVDVGVAAASGGADRSSSADLRQLTESIAVAQPAAPKGGNEPRYFHASSDTPRKSDRQSSSSPVPPLSLSGDAVAAALRVSDDAEISATRDPTPYPAPLRG